MCVCVCGLRCSYNLIVTHVWNNILFYKRLSFLILILGTHTALQVTRSVYILVPDPPLPTHTHHTTQPVCLVCSHLTRPLHTHTHTAGVPAQSFFKHHSAIHDTIKGQLIPSYLTSMCPSLSAELNNSLSCHGNSGEAELMDFVRDPMFEAVVRQLFGKENVPSTRVGCMCVWVWLKVFLYTKSSQKITVAFMCILLLYLYSPRWEVSCTSLSSTTLILSTEQNCLKYSSGEIIVRPGKRSHDHHMTCREWRDSRNWLLSAFKHVISRVKAGKSEEKKPTVLEHLLRMVDPPSAHNYALLLLWASQANAIPVRVDCKP